jgi:hypothetical protein
MYSQQILKRITRTSLVLWGAVLFVSLCAFAQQKGEIKVTVKPNQTLRDVSREYLKDPDLWEEILRSNNLRAPSDVVSGMTLTIPVANILRAKKAVDEALAEIQKANQAGAKSFASKLIDNAVRYYDQSVKERKLTRWDKSFQLASQSKQEANNAYNESVLKSSPPGEASVSFTKGKVEGKKSVETLWKSVFPSAKLLENDRIRTYAAAYAEVLFQDKSKIRLSENALAVIQRNRMDLLKNTGETKVTLEKGDAFAVLFGSPKKKSFKLEVPGLETNVKSKSFWVNREEKGTKIANYDGELELKSKNQTITLKQNQGSSMSSSGALSQPKDLVKAPASMAPVNEKVIYSGEFTVQWTAVAGAAKYWLVIAKDATFKSVLEQWKDISQTTKTAQLEKGVYFWRVASVDAEGFPGPFGEIRSFTLIVDNDPPYIAVSHPLENSVSFAPEIDVKGATEPGVKIMVNGGGATLDGELGFSVPVTLNEGANTILIEGVDNNGNKTQIKRNVTFSRGTDINIIFEPPIPFSGKNTLYCPTSSITVKGKTKPLASIQVIIEPTKVNVKALADSSGAFVLTFNNIEDELTAVCTAQSREGVSASETLVLKRDRQLPALTFKDELPALTADRELVIIGQAENCGRINLNGEVIDVRDNKFQTVYPLKDGKNTLIFKAKNDRSSEVTEVRDVVLDTRPPELVSQRVFLNKEKDRGVIIFEVRAKDNSTLKKTAKIVYQTGEMLFTEYLKLEETESLYRGSVYYTGKPPVVTIKLILLEDQLNNSKEYNFFE